MSKKLLIRSVVTVTFAVQNKPHDYEKEICHTYISNTLAAAIEKAEKEIPEGYEIYSIKVDHARDLDS